jgi:hypothetical protein
VIEFALVIIQERETPPKKGGLEQLGDFWTVETQER